MKPPLMMQLKTIKENDYVNINTFHRKKGWNSCILALKNYAEICLTKCNNYITTKVGMIVLKC